MFFKLFNYQFLDCNVKMSKYFFVSQANSYGMLSREYLNALERRLKSIPKFAKLNHLILDFLMSSVDNLFLLGMYFLHFLPAEHLEHLCAYYVLVIMRNTVQSGCDGRIIIIG